MSLFFLALLSGFASLLFDFENNSWSANCIFVNTPASHRIPHVYTKRVKEVKMKGLNEWKEKRRPSVSWLQKNKVSTLFNRVLNVFTLNKSAPGIIVTNSKNKKPHTVPYFKKERRFSVLFVLFIFLPFVCPLTDAFFQTLLTLFTLSGTHMVLQINMS